MESAKDVVMEAAADKNDLSRTVSEKDASMSPKIEKKNADVPQSRIDTKSVMSLNKIE